MQQKQAFTLVELSIVLVILGLLIGGVLTGQSLIRAAELRSIATQQSRFVTATQTFRDKYFGLPGDLNNAQSYWGVAHATAATCVTTASTTTATCNGDGNGLIDLSAGANERFRFWQHLANAGLIEGSYTGIATSGSSGTSALNAPAGRIASTYWGANNAGAVTSNLYYFDGQYDNVFLFGGFVNNSWPVSTIFKPEEVYNIDAKIDDGKPATGKVVSYNNNLTNTATSCTDANASTSIGANYLLSNTAASCAFIFRQAF